ncbi:MAG: hypothetical protein VXZ84_11205 [Planctomycetota bacterium]|nr:hypothetical protein [Planctomycetota bacterium]
MNRLSSNVMLEELKAIASDTEIVDGFPADDHSQINTQIDIAEGKQEAADHSEICSVFTPLHFEPNYAYPLLIWLHGEDENEMHLRQVMPKISMRNYAAVAPRGTLSLSLDEQQTSQSNGTFSWSLRNGDYCEAIERVCRAIERAEERFKIDKDRIFLAGKGSGGTMALQIGMTLPETFSGVISVGGPLPRKDALLAHLDKSRQVPVLLTVDRDNDQYPDTMVCADLRLLHIAGMTVTLRQYPAGEILRDSMLSDIDQWIMDVLASEKKTPIVTG